MVQKQFDVFEVWVKAEATQGLANQEMAERIADFFNVSFKNIRIIKGARSPHKIIEIMGI